MRGIVVGGYSARPGMTMEAMSASDSTTGGSSFSSVFGGGGELVLSKLWCDLMGRRKKHAQ